jgi:Domain of unknown function (DUF4150)
MTAGTQVRTMSLTIKVNGTVNSVVHKGSNHFSMATIPDVCKTPSPGGPIPIPYPNVSMSNSLDKGTTTVKADGGNMVAIKGSEFAMSQGDEPGTAGGVKSGTFKKESTWILYSFDVKLEGKNACRLTDKKFQNHENTADMMGAGGQTVSVLDNFTKVLCRFLKECTDAEDKGAEPTKAQCDAVVGADARGRPVTRAMQRGTNIDACVKGKIKQVQDNPKATPFSKTIKMDPPAPAWGTNSYPDIVVGNVPGSDAVFDIKTSCPPSKPKPDWPKYGAGRFDRAAANEAWHGKSQAEVYQEACGVTPTMIHAKSPECRS